MDVVFDNLDLFLRGIRTTVTLTLTSFVIAFVIGLVVASFRVSPIPPLRLAGAAYVNTVRNTPLAVLMVLFYFGLPDVGILYSAYVSAVIVLSAYTGAFVAETVRAGINSVAQGQAEAARALGMTYPQVLRIVIMPQALRSVIAPLGSIFIALIKNSALANLLSVTELSGTAERLINETARPIPLFVAAGFCYLVLTIPSGILLGRIERRYAIKR